MDNNENTIPGADALNVAAAGGSTAATDEVVSVKDLLNTILGKNFPDDAAAVKAVKDTFNYVGKVGKYMPVITELQTKYGGEPGALEVLSALTKSPATPATDTQPRADDGKFVSREQYDQDTFYAQNQALAPFKSMITAVQKAGNFETPQAAIEGDATLKASIEKATAYDKQQGNKSVLQTNPRLGQVTDNIAQARTAQKEGNQTQAAGLAVNAVLEAFEPKQ